MSKRDALRALSNKFPSPPELTAIMDAALKQPDRIAAIVVGAVVASMLEKIIIANIKFKSPDLIGKLFKDRGPLSDLHSKILIATAFGIIDPLAMIELNRMKVIRNVFAHARVDVTFDTPEIASEVDGFILLGALRAGLDTMENPPVITNKWAFVTIVRIFCSQISENHKELSGAALFAQPPSI